MKDEGALHDEHTYHHHDEFSISFYVMLCGYAMLTESLWAKFTKPQTMTTSEKFVHIVVVIM